uniref:Uncharacterized protein n=1 Tax=Rhizophora mucronata TaxID=61149 RepID=A0A2P2PPG3_RHIMU
MQMVKLRSTFQAKMEL